MIGEWIYLAGKECTEKMRWGSKRQKGVQRKSEREKGRMPEVQRDVGGRQEGGG